MGVLIKPSGEAVQASVLKQVLASAFIIGATNPERDFRLPKNKPEFLKMVTEFTLEIIARNHNPNDPETQKHHQIKAAALKKIMGTSKPEGKAKENTNPVEKQSETLLAKQNTKIEDKLLQAAQDGLTFATEREKVIEQNAKGYSQKTKLGTGAVVGSALTSLSSTLLEMYTAYPLLGGVALGIAGLSLFLNKPVREAVQLTRENITRARKESYQFSTTTLRALIKEKAYLNTALVNSKKRERDIIFKAAAIYKNIEKEDKAYLKTAYEANEKNAAGLSM